VGMSIVRTMDELSPALQLAAQFEKLILIEKYIDGIEITVPIWMGKVLPEIEIVPKTEWYDYKRKYTPGMTEHIIPARISEEVRRKCQKYAIETFKAMGCRHYGRVDIRIDKQGSPFVLEINTLPGCTETSLFPESAAHAGISFENFIETLIENATLDYK
jgi:D-alanine-D-alanine ligase